MSTDELDSSFLVGSTIFSINFDGHLVFLLRKSPINGFGFFLDRAIPFCPFCLVVSAFCWCWQCISALYNLFLDTL